MSNEIKCKECGFANPHSSKFCNNCGAKLPLSTHIICPNCETPNTRDRIFCDTCGTRLVAETTQPEPEEPESNQPAPNEPFSLPARRPGETGELNPNAVPDWLRTGDIGSTKDAPEVPEEDKPEKKGTSDLPEWLVHDSDPEPIINAPTTISTEFYQDLLDKAEDLPQPDDLFADEEEADLPDWLSDAAEPPEERLDPSAGLTSWLRDLDDSEESEETAVSAEDAEDVSSGLTDWLQELDDLGNARDEHEAENAAALEELLDDHGDEEADDWLQELGPAQTDIFSPPTDEPEKLEDSDDLPGWMDELGPLQTNLLNPEQMAELTGPLAGLSDDDIVDDEEAGADVSFTDLFETSGSETEKLPDWLDAAAEEGETFLSDLPPELTEADSEPEPEIVSEPGSDWFTADQIVAETELDWLEETGNLESAAEVEASALEEPETSDAFSFDDIPDDEFDFEELEAQAETDGEADASELDRADDDLDWLTDMEAIQTGELVIEPEEEVVEETPASAEREPVAEDESVSGPEPEAEEDSWTSDDFFAETAVDEDLPAWLDQLDKPEEAADTVEQEPADTELPEWIASMRPGQGIIGSELPGVFSEIDLRDTLEGIPEELAGAELPEWLQGAPLESDTATPISEAETEGPLEIPDWLQPEDEDAAEGKPTAGSTVEPAEMGSGRSEWRSLLEELPPLTPLAETLPKAEIPEWVQQLKPTELTGEPPREPEGPAETAGPLQGMQGIISIEPAIARPRTAMLPTPYVTTPEQEQQVALLRQIAQEAPETVTTLSAKSAYGTAAWLRLSLALLLIVALLAGLLGPNLVASELAVPDNVVAFDTAVAAAAGQAVLVAIEYTPAMAGELTPQAELLLDQLAANNSPVLITSQYAAGTGVAAALVAEEDAQIIGYLPGEGIGLRQLGDCLGGRSACDQLNGRMLAPELQANLSDVGLVILLTGDRDNLVNWVEQVGTVATETPLVAGVTQALAPVANSYASTTQLSGLLGGLPDTAAYEQLRDASGSDVQGQLNAQIFGQLMVGVLLLIGLLSYGATGLMNSRRNK